MTILSSFRKPPHDAVPVDPAQENAPDEAELPFPDYDQLSDRDLVAKLSNHTQVELEAVDTYENSHKTRPAVLNKLRYLRGPEPLSDYDGLDFEQISAEIKDADLETVKKMRTYERKFQHRSNVLDRVATALRERRPATTHRAT
jgi:hypothetical protein